LLSKLDALPAQCHVQARLFGLSRAVEKPLGVRDRHVHRVGDVETKVGEQRAAVGGDGTRRRVRILKRDDVGLISESRKQVADCCPHRRVVGTGLGPDDDVDRVAGLAGESLGEQLLGLGRVRARRRIVSGELTGEGGRKPGGEDQPGDPGEDHPTTAAEGVASEAAERSGAGRRGVGGVGSRVVVADEGGVGHRGP
jgi:hypothetical protein